MLEPPTPQTLVDALRLFNRKERFILLEHATGSGDHLRLGSDFADSLSAAIGVDVPQGAYLAVDYHLDWLYAAIRTYLGGWSTDGGVLHTADGEPVHAAALTASQEDVDLIVAWEKAEISHIIMVEAKAYSGWTNAQLRSKVRRLRQIFDDDGCPLATRHVGGPHSSIRAHFVLTGFGESAGVDPAGWPPWTIGQTGRPRFLALRKPTERWGVQRTDADGKPWTAPEGQPQSWSLRRFGSDQAEK